MAVAEGEWGKKAENEMRGSLRKETRNEMTRTPRLLASVGTPGETGVWRPDGLKPEAGEGTGPGSGGVAGNPVAKSERENTKDT